MDAGEVKTGSLDLLVGGISELLPGLGSGNSEWTLINCVAGDFDLRSGIATSRVALLDSEVLAWSAKDKSISRATRWSFMSVRRRRILRSTWRCR